MEFNTISFVIVYLVSLSAGAVLHNPKVTEDDSDNVKDNNRPIINQEKLQNPSQPDFNAAAFTIQRFPQSDYLKQRYAEQQQINVEEIAKLRRKPSTKSLHKIYDQSNLEHDQSLEPYDWQPLLSEAKRRKGKSSKEYIPLMIRTSRKNRDTRDGTNNKPDLNNKDGLASSSAKASHIIYVDPQILRQVFELKNKQKQIQSRSISLEHVGDVDTNSLSELIGKNPHIQLESLRRILQDPQNRNKIFPFIGGPQPFQQKDHTPIMEKQVDIPNPRSQPNIQVAPLAHEEVPSSIIPQAGQVITKETFDKIQKQLDESSKFQVQDALLRAQQAAEAHVAAQHKAIEQAQRAIFENVHKQLQDAPQALRLVQENIPQYATHINAPVHHQQAVYSTPLPGPVQHPQHSYSTPLPAHVQQQQPVYSTPLPHSVQQQHRQSVYSTPLPEQVSTAHDVSVPLPNVQVHTYKTTSIPIYVPNSIDEDKSARTAQNTQRPNLNNIQIIKIIPTTKLPQQFYAQPKIKHFTVSQNPIVKPHAQGIKHYAPNHLHQAIAQLQAEKVLLEQVQSHNDAILSGSNVLSKHTEQKQTLDSLNEEKNHEKEAQPSANAYQHIILEHSGRKKHKKIVPEETHLEEQDDLQYAAKYAFGYRIKDNKEGSDFGHQEKRNGRSAEGSYEVLLPDGRRQKVEYYADDSGYHAKVTYENVATHS